LLIQPCLRIPGGRSEADGVPKFTLLLEGLGDADPALLADRVDWVLAGTLDG